MCTGKDESFTALYCTACNHMLIVLLILYRVNDFTIISCIEHVYLGIYVYSSCRRDINWAHNFMVWKILTQQYMATNCVVTYKTCIAAFMGLLYNINYMFVALYCAQGWPHTQYTRILCPQPWSISWHDHYNSKTAIYRNWIMEI